MRQTDRPVYLQLRDHVAAAILDGDYADGDLLPSVRAFAAEQGANPLTAAKAYQMFQDDGLIEVRRGIGMFVANGATARLRASERDRFLREEWPVLTARLKRIGVAPGDLLAETAG